ncbi:MAG: murein biosynthesis integral membrane protein MurJ [Actinomycetaceae bacterium]|nr:murein biosynthesis integral membrane protein MurJ [Actinomycetaceae bacterium]
MERHISQPSAARPHKGGSETHSHEVAAANRQQIKRTNILRASFVMSAGTLLSRLLGFVRSILLIAAIGSTGASDAFQVANTMPNVLYNLLAVSVLNAILVPQFVRALQRKNGSDYINRLLTLFVVIFMVLTLLAVLGATVLVNIFASQMAPSWKAVAVAFSLLCLPQIFFYGLYTIWGQLLNAQGSFGPYMWAPVLNNVIAIPGLLAFIFIYGDADKWATQPQIWTAGPIWLLCGSATLGIIAQAMVLLIPLHHSGFRLKLVFGLGGYDFSAVSKTAAWSFASMCMNYIGFLAQSNVAAAANGYAVEHGVTIAATNAWTTTFMVFMVPQSAIVLSITTALFTQLSDLVSRGQLRAVAHQFVRISCVMLPLTSFFTAALSVAAIPTMQIIMPTRSFEEVEVYAGVLIIYAFAIPALSIWSLITRVFLADNDARTVFFIQIPQLFVIAGCSFAGYYLLPARLWTQSAAFGEALAYFIVCLIGIIVVRRRIPSIRLVPIVNEFLRSVAATIAAAATGYMLLEHWGRFSGSDGGSTSTHLFGAIMRVFGVGFVMFGVFVVSLLIVRSRGASMLLQPLARKLGSTHISRWLVNDPIIGPAVEDAQPSPNETEINDKLDSATMETLVSQQSLGYAEPAPITGALPIVTPIHQEVNVAEEYAAGHVVDDTYKLIECLWSATEPDRTLWRAKTVSDKYLPTDTYVHLMLLPDAGHCGNEYGEESYAKSNDKTDDLQGEEGTVSVSTLIKEEDEAAVMSDTKSDDNAHPKAIAAHGEQPNDHTNDTHHGDSTFTCDASDNTDNPPNSLSSLDQWQEWATSVARVKAADKPHRIQQILVHSPQIVAFVVPTGKALTDLLGQGLKASQITAITRVLAYLTQQVHQHNTALGAITSDNVFIDSYGTLTLCCENAVVPRSPQQGAVDNGHDIIALMYQMLTGGSFQDADNIKAGIPYAHGQVIQPSQLRDDIDVNIDAVALTGTAMPGPRLCYAISKQLPTVEIEPFAGVDTMPQTPVVTPDNDDTDGGITGEKSEKAHEADTSPTGSASHGAVPPMPPLPSPKDFDKAVTVPVASEVAKVEGGVSSHDNAAATQQNEPCNDSPPHNQTASPDDTSNTKIFNGTDTDNRSDACVSEGDTSGKDANEDGCDTASAENDPIDDAPQDKQQPEDSPADTDSSDNDIQGILPSTQSSANHTHPHSSQPQHTCDPNDHNGITEIRTHVAAAHAEPRQVPPKPSIPPKPPIPSLTSAPSAPIDDSAPPTTALPILSSIQTSAGASSHPEQSGSVASPSENRAHAAPAPMQGLDASAIIRSKQSSRQLSASDRFFAPAKPAQPTDKNAINASRVFTLTLVVLFVITTIASVVMLAWPTETDRRAAAIQKRIEKEQQVDPSAQAVEPSDPPVIAAVTSLDPEGDKNEHPELADKMIDGEAGTQWMSRYYTSPTFGNKSGIGIGITLEKKTVVKTITISSPCTGGTLEVRATPSDKPKDGKALVKSTFEETTVLELPKPINTDSLVVWIPELPKDDEGRNRAKISELKVE